MIIDTHAHLYFPQLVNDLDDIIDICRGQGITKIIVPAVDMKTCETILSLASKYDMIYAALGFHPSDVKGMEEESLKFLESILNESKVVAVGETGLDYYWDKTYNDKQIYYFHSQIELAKKFNLPVIVHTRESTSDALNITSEYPEVNFQYHCFSGSNYDLIKLLKLKNHLLSFCGNITYKKSDLTNLFETPIERMMFETDSPFLTPVPYRGKTNYPYHVIHTINKIASVKNMDIEELKEKVYRTTCNFYNF